MKTTWVLLAEVGHSIVDPTIWVWDSETEYLAGRIRAVKAWVEETVEIPVGCIGQRWTHRTLDDHWVFFALVPEDEA